MAKRVDIRIQNYQRVGTTFIERGGRLEPHFPLIITPRGVYRISIILPQRAGERPYERLQAASTGEALRDDLSALRFSLRDWKVPEWMSRALDRFASRAGVPS